MFEDNTSKDHPWLLWESGELGCVAWDSRLHLSIAPFISSARTYLYLHRGYTNSTNLEAVCKLNLCDELVQISDSLCVDLHQTASCAISKSHPPRNGIMQKYWWKLIWHALTNPPNWIPHQIFWHMVYMYMWMPFIVQKYYRSFFLYYYRFAGNVTMKHLLVVLKHSDCQSSVQPQPLLLLSFTFISILHKQHNSC